MYFGVADENGQEMTSEPSRGEHDDNLGGPVPPPVTGRTAYDGLVEIVRDVFVVLGRATPYVVILVLIVFGAYKFVELERVKLDEVHQARVKALNENAETISQLKDQILKDASSITSLQSSNVDVIVKQITAQQQIAAIITESMARIATLTEQSVQFKADIAEKEAKQQALAEQIAAISQRYRQIEEKAKGLDTTARVAAHLIEVLSDERTFVPTRNLSQISERYEGGTADHVGQDYAGNYYYGIFRIRGGLEMKAFVDYLSHQDPFSSKALASAFNAGAASGAQGFVSQWKSLAERPSFADLQRAYITDNDYAATVKTCKIKGHLKLPDQSIAFQSVMWAATVQNGPSWASRFCTDNKDKWTNLSQRVLIDKLYELREKALMTDFEEQAPLINRLLRLRYELEKKDAYRILEEIDAED